MPSLVGSEMCIRDRIFPGYLEQKIIRAMIEAHPYEEVAYDIISLGNYLSDVGSGLIGELENAVGENEFLQKIKTAFNLQAIRHTKLLGKQIKKVAVCGGAGSFLIPVALSNRADVYITSDIKSVSYTPLTLPTNREV